MQIEFDAVRTTIEFTQPQNTKSRPTNSIANRMPSCLRTRIHPVQLKKITEDILHKIYTEKVQ